MDLEEKQVKIIFLNKYQLKVSRGAETFVSELSKRLSKKHEVEVVSDINYFELLQKEFNVIIPTNGRLQVVLVRIISWIKGAKMIVSGQSGIGVDDRVNIYSFPDYFIGLSTKAKEWAKKTNPFVKSIYIPNGVDLGKFNPNGQKIVIGLPQPVILSVGALESNKRLNLAIKAVSKLKKGSLLFVGKGGEKENLKKLAEKLIPGRFKIMSFDHKDMPKVYRSVDLFTFSTVPWESFGIVLVEAMASGLGVVASDDKIRKEIIGTAGILVDPTNTDKYATALKKALDTNWEEKSRKQAKKFDWDIIAKSYEKLFKKL